MRPLVSLQARACPLPYANIDTDQLIPARYLRRPRAENHGPFLLHDLRRLPDGELDPGFTLNHEVYRGAEIAVARRNFGCGSSREAAVYALADFGFRVVVAPSFGDIFAANAIKNGVLPAVVAEPDAEALLTALLAGDAPEVEVDLPNQSLRYGAATIGLTIDPVWKEQLINGWDDIDLTLNEGPAIAAFWSRDAAERPWARPRG